ncbi:esterase-like activity of phytase family protein [Nocardia yamanashiensis]|uniref:esterase-like activity of phytase family protein n=1 Tax=Nocardia yamanashiensis TaxID=209247 RepID=UPI001E2A6B18|nr:esterase-like activity of phytase family protein [Nocardia yamanashiensis]UGT45380.1 esterase-like activity of phytase family protein [Nocardia yamanashiensis]
MSGVRALALAFAVVVGTAGAAGVATGENEAGPDALTVRHLDQFTLGDDYQFGGYRVGGLSGLDYWPEGDSYLAISDNRGEEGPARAYTLSVPITPEGKLGAPEFRSLIELLDKDGSPYAARTIDPEAIRWTPDHQGFVYTSEGEAKTGQAGFVRQATLDGAYSREVPVPDAFTPRTDAAGQQISGIRDNLGFEGMDLTEGGSTVVAVSENALVQDGPAASADAESRSRLVQSNRGSGQDIAEYIYPVGRVGLGEIASSAGISEILSLGGDRYLTLERGVIPVLGFTGRIYETSTAGADPVTGKEAAPADAKPMSKRLLFDFRAAGIDPQCVEGMTWGPRLPDGSRSLIIVADNNFGRAGRTTFHLLSVSGG